MARSDAVWTSTKTFISVLRPRKHSTDAIKRNQSPQKPLSHVSQRLFSFAAANLANKIMWHHRKVEAKWTESRHYFTFFCFFKYLHNFFEISNKRVNARNSNAFMALLSAPLGGRLAAPGVGDASRHICENRVTRHRYDSGLRGLWFRMLVRRSGTTAFGCRHGIIPICSMYTRV